MSSRLWLSLSEIMRGPCQRTKPPGGVSPDGFATVNPDVGNVRRDHAIAFACIDNETRSLSLMSAPRVNSGTASQSPVLLIGEGIFPQQKTGVSTIVSTIENPSPIDWDMARRHFESGVSLRNIADLVGASSSGVAKHAKRHRWQRTRKACAPKCAPPTTKAERLSFRISPLIEHAAFEVPVLASKGRQIILSLMDELERETANSVTLSALIEGETAEEKTGNRRRLLEKAASLPVRDGDEKSRDRADSAHDGAWQEGASAA
jgi:hypothetical protein